MHRLRHDKPYRGAAVARQTVTLTVPEAGALSGIPARVVRAAVLNGDMPACYAGSTTMRIRRTDLDEWVANLPVDPPTPK